MIPPLLQMAYTGGQLSKIYFTACLSVFTLRGPAGGNIKDKVTGALRSGIQWVTSYSSWKKNINPRNKLGQANCTFCVLRLKFTPLNIKKWRNLFGNEVAYLSLCFCMGAKYHCLWDYLAYIQTSVACFLLAEGFWEWAELDYIQDVNQIHQRNVKRIKI